MSSKSKTKTNTTMTYGSVTPQDTPDIIAARQAAAQDSGADPTIKYRFARQRDRVNNDFSPFGANIAPETAEAMRYSRLGDLDNQFGAELAADSFRRRQQKFQNLYSMAGLTAPRIVQTGGSSTGTVSQPMWPGLIAGGLSAAAGAL
jgi:hypothetical protein